MEVSRGRVLHSQGRAVRAQRRQDGIRQECSELGSKLNEDTQLKDPIRQKFRPPERDCLVFEVKLGVLH